MLECSHVECSTHDLDCGRPFSSTVYLPGWILSTVAQTIRCPITSDFNEDGLPCKSRRSNISATSARFHLGNCEAHITSADVQPPSDQVPVIPSHYKAILSLLVSDTFSFTLETRADACTIPLASRLSQENRPWHDAPEKDLYKQSRGMVRVFVHPRDPLRQKLHAESSNGPCSGKEI